MVHPLSPSLKCDALAPVSVALATVSAETPSLPMTTLSSTDRLPTGWLPNREARRSHGHLGQARAAHLDAASAPA
jgi:hypothetical protein